jgi:1-acyl-sn-glycerol-3-phosphate acyltransferase
MVRGILALLANVVLVPGLGIPGLLVALVDKRHHPLHISARYWARALLRVCGARIRIEGRDILEHNRPALVVANHTSNLDIYLTCGHAPIPFMIPAKAELFRIPVLGAVMRGLGMVPLERSRSAARDMRQIDKMAENFQDDAVLIFFPEGTRSPDGRLRRFKKGAFTIAIRHGVPVIPIAIEGAYRIQPTGSFKIRGGLLKAMVLPPIPTKDLSMDDRDWLSDQAHAAIAAALPERQQPGS